MKTPLSSILFVFTAGFFGSFGAAFLKAGAFGYVPKPFNLVYLDHIAAIASAQTRRPSA